MSPLRESVRPFADHPVVQSMSALWAELPRVMLIGAVVVAAAVPSWALLAVRAPAAAVLAGWLLLGPAWMVVLRSVAGVTHTNAIRLPARGSEAGTRVIRDGLALAAPVAAGALCTLAAGGMEHASTAGSVVRGLALGVDLAVCGTVLVVLPAASALAGRGVRMGRSAWAAAAALTGAAPLLVVEVVALGVVLALLAHVAGGVGLLPVLLLGPPVLATVICGLWAGDGTARSSSPHRSIRR